VQRSTNLQATAYGGARLANPALPVLTVDDEFVPVPDNAVSINARYQDWRIHLQNAIGKKKAGKPQ
jgi:hypothetical protein